MGVYKVPQDVEADDKLLGPFSFKQFIFLIVSAIGLGLAYALSRIMLPLALIPLPIAIFFAVLALPLRKDQPMEIYLAAVISFILRPKVRIWQADGIETMIEVVAPRTDDKPLMKHYSQEEIQKRMSYLANIVDSQGWSLRGVEQPNSTMHQELYNEAQAIDDPMDSTGDRINKLLIEQGNSQKQQIMHMMQQQGGQPQQQTTTPTTPPATDQPDLANSPQLQINPYPTMTQTVIKPLDQQTKPETKTSLDQVSPDIINLAGNHTDWSVATLQREAKRIKEKEEAEQEVVISLR